MNRNLTKHGDTEDTEKPEFRSFSPVIAVLLRLK
jgi:hypothetical protein